MSTLETNLIQPSTGTTLTLGASGDTITVPSGASLSVPSGGLSGQNYPAFEAYLSANQTFTNLAITKVQFNTEVLDTNNYYDNATNYRFTPQVSGKYYVYSGVQIREGLFNIEQQNLWIYKNGSAYRNAGQYISASKFSISNLSQSAIIDMNGSTDYIEIFTTGRYAGGTPTIEGGSSNTTYFGAYRIGS